MGLASSPGTAVATDASGFTSTFVGPTAFDDIDVKVHTDTLKVMIKTWGLADVYVVTNTVLPGGHSGWHTHPGPSVVSVIAGTATYYDGDDPICTRHVIPTGEGFIDQGGGHVHLVRNEGSDTLTLVAFQIIPAGAARRIGVPNPGNCPF
jgi:quercetin dioxygenase-like cupin family protein